jgi:transposase
MKTIKVESVVFRDDLYPRIETSVATVQKYAEDLSVLPPIAVNQHNELIDGWHRWTAHKKNEAEEIRVVVVETASDAELLEKAIETNATHGLQLSQADKKAMAQTIYNGTPDKDRETKKKELAKILSVSERTVRDWLSRIDKDAKAARKERIFSMWLAGYTQQEIAADAGMPRKTVADEIASYGENGSLANLAKTDQNAANHETDFDTPIYNVWKQQAKTSGSSHFGNSEVRWVDKLLYLYTSPFDVVLDPFAGGGSTIDICKKRFRRYFVSDRKPIVEREKEIRQHDLKCGPLKPPQWDDVKLLYLDPPYWIQAAGQYSDDADDLANQSLEDFTANLSKIVKQYSAKMSDAYIALIIQPTQWKAPERVFVDHVGDLLRSVKLPVEMRYSVPYESQQCNAQMVEWAKDSKRCLVLSREIIVWRVK